MEPLKLNCFHRICIAVKWPIYQRGSLFFKRILRLLCCVLQFILKWFTKPLYFLKEAFFPSDQKVLNQTLEQLLNQNFEKAFKKFHFVRRRIPNYFAKTASLGEEIYIKNSKQLLDLLIKNEFIILCKKDKNRERLLKNILSISEDNLFKDFQFGLKDWNRISIRAYVNYCSEIIEEMEALEQSLIVMIQTYIRDYSECLKTWSPSCIIMRDLFRRRLSPKETSPLTQERENLEIKMFKKFLFLVIQNVLNTEKVFIWI